MARSKLPVLLGAGLAVTAAIPAALAAFSARTAQRVTRAIPPVGRIMAIGGEQIHVSDQGNGAPGKPVILMVHGLGGNMLNLLMELAPRLKDEYRIVAIDRPGSGHSVGAPGRPGNVRAHAWVVRDVIEALGLERPLLVGHSLGGAIALATALDHPKHVGGLALIAPLTDLETAPPAVFQGLAVTNPLTRRIIAWTLAVPTSIRQGAETLAHVFGPDKVPDNFATAGGGLLGLRPSAYETASRDLVASGQDLPGLIERYRTLKLPVGVLYGSKDQVLSAKKHGAAMRERIEGLQYEEIEGAGHMIPITRPEETAAFIRRMAARVG